MTQSNKRAIWSLCIWGPIALAFVVLFFIVGKPATYTDTRIVRILISAIFGLGFLSYALMLFQTRLKPGQESYASDERDEMISMQGANAGMIVVMVYVYVLAMGLFLNYEEVGSVPVGWMWFLAYSTMLMAFLSASTITLILHQRGEIHG